MIMYRNYSYCECVIEKDVPKYDWTSEDEFVQCGTERQTSTIGIIAPKIDKNDSFLKDCIKYRYDYFNDKNLIIHSINRKNIDHLFLSESA